MITVKSVVKINTNKLRQLDKSAVKSLEETGEALHTEVVQAQVVPRDTGTLQNEKMFLDTSNSQNGKVSIIHEGPYARRLYYHPEYNFRSDENPNAKGHWFEDWKKGGVEQDFCRKTFAKIYREKTDL